MKQIIVVLALLLSFNFAYTQILKGKVTYQATLNNDDFYNRLIKDTIMTQTRKKLHLETISSTYPSKFHLMINGNEALYQAEYDPATKVRIGYKPNRTDRVAQHENIYYSDLETNEKFYESFWTKGVLVNLNEIDWTLTQETKKIGVYICYKATAIISSEQLFGMNFMSPIIAWYTPQIPVSFGIKEFAGLPGLTLELLADYENGKVFYTATKIELNPEEEINIKKPKGKKVSEQEYIALIERLNNARKVQRQ
ncbi:GLPGLI family protein [Arenibacter sp. TNZ]|uniref:GLPGLI family protein n=1 Tax=Arenibacter TaxID=178469 RepID=UPI000CD4489B|nr:MULTISPECIES: GLPGLI family protein [Arenibacter]MCM4173959.1 GLPGLI family protein [Arenibacter sp. TNZ]